MPTAAAEPEPEPEPEPQPQPQPQAAASSGSSEGGPTCWLCLTDGPPGLLRGCACRGSAGFAHLPCLVTAATYNPAIWVSCPTCKQDFFGEVRRGLAAARWELAAALADGSTERLAAQAALLESQGRFAEAVPLFEQVLARERAALGDEHSEVITSLYSLAVLCSMNGEKEKALLLAEESLAGKKLPLLRHFVLKEISRSVYQDRLGTNIGKAALKKRVAFSRRETPNARRR
jgi:hypothetical protein